MAASEQVEIIEVYAGPDRRSDGKNDDYVRIALRAIEKRDKPVHSAYRRPSLYENLRHASAPVFCELFGKAVSYILLGRALSRFGGPNSNLASYPSHLEKESVREYLLPLIFTQQQYL